MLTVHGRKLKAPQVLYNGKFRDPHDAEWNMINLNFYNAKPVLTWSYLCVGGATLSQKSIGQFTHALALCGMGKTAPSPPTGFRTRWRGNDDDDKKDVAIHDAFQEASKAKIPILLVILKSKYAVIRASVKYWADTEFGMCMMSFKLCSSRSSRGL